MARATDVHSAVMMIEAALWMRDLDTTRRYEQRLRRDSVQLGHRLGIAWADTCNALIAMLQKDYETAAPALRSGAEALEAIPWLLDAARVRPKLAWVLAKTGDLDGATRELRRAHDAFIRMRAEVELGISPRTVNTHLSSIFLELEVASRGELADVARRQGLLVT